MNDSENNKSKTVLTATVTQKSKSDAEWEEMQKEMQADLNAKASQAALNLALSNSKVAEYINKDKIVEYIDKAQPFVPLIKSEIRKYFGKDEIRFMIYLDDESDALVFEKVHSAKVDFAYKEEQDPKDFFVIEMKDLDNLKDSIKKMQNKFGINLF